MTPQTLKTARLTLIPSTLELADAELEDPARFSQLLEAIIPAAWPPESARDALPLFLDLTRKNPDWVGWLGWYAVLGSGSDRVLCAGAGFKGPPDASGMVETGYSVLPEFQGQGIAVEMVTELARWVLDQPGVCRIEAETTPDNLASCRVLERIGFVRAGAGIEAGGIRFRLEPGKSAG